MTILTYNPYLTYASKGVKGAWKDARLDGKRTATVACPGCGEVASLSGYEIAEDGMVSPSLVCPYDCGFHDRVKLDGWTS